MTEFNEGDLVEAVKDERFVRDRVTRHGETGDLFVLGVGFLTNDSGRAETRHGYTLTVIEKAAPKIVLPSEPGFYRDLGNEGAGWELIGSRWFKAGRTEAFDPDVEADRKTLESVAPFTKLEPAATTLNALLADLTTQVQSRIESGWYARTTAEDILVRASAIADSLRVSS